MAVSLQPGDGKSTTQKLSDEASSVANATTDSAKSALGSTQETLGNLGQQPSSCANAAGEQSKTYLEQAQEVAIKVVR